MDLMVHGPPQINSVELDRFGRIARKEPTYGDTELKKAWDSIALKTRSAKMGNGEHATAFNMLEICDRLQGHDCNYNGPPSLAKLLNWAGGHSNSVFWTSRSATFQGRKMKLLIYYLGMHVVFIDLFALFIVLFRSGCPDHLKFE